ncbi:7-cyano-7-deazaguanine synthase QueC [Sulfuriflexus sp.]|uniref:7-cyano-7-deazaguanine synthase QueC n=1 Tax=Sulfuriflexus sp. TaxID=2015443 RepID=UPI0028CD7067|nr:7-cyano-7-deazaguanine synthase QueC [Sulfuriflexus sp.]MDT8404266.1 7-cyano-7-deazaguanine synthase QueC [Sulfuriflexus sp.]
MNEVTKKKRAVVLVSGGLDSATTLAIARAEGYDCFALSFDYGQRHVAELAAADRVTDMLGVAEHKRVYLDLGTIGGSALTEACIDVPKDGVQPDTIPVTYVPARNTVFLSIALGWAEVLGAQDIFIGVNAVDYSGYPDCRPAFIRAFEQVANLATRAGVEGQHFHIHTPLIDLSKAEIIRMGTDLGIDYARTISCYDADIKGQACGECDSCRLRRQGFAAAGLPDPTLYR